MKRKSRMMVCAAVAALLAVFLLPAVYRIVRSKNNVTKTVVEPGCTEPGYIVTTRLDTGTTQVEHLPARGHTFGDWAPDEGAGVRVRTCSACSFQESVRISTIAEDALPKLYLTGSMENIGKKASVALKAKFVSEENTFQCYAITTLQGHSTFGYPKHNYTIRFYDDDQSIVKHRLQFRNWNPEHKYILKANYTDLSQCRNLVGARIWSEMAACRNNLSPRLAALPCYGAVDGFPIEVYLNGAFFGLYTMNLHKDDDLYQMKDGETAAMAICNRHTTDEALFKARAAFLPDYSSDWEIEFCGTADEAWARSSFNGLIDFVMKSSDQEFAQRLSEHLDVDAAIDYLIFIYALGLPNSAAKDMVMLNYGDVWIPSAYDMDEAFGLDAGAAAYLSPEDFLPDKKDGVWQSGTGSLLWDRLLNAFEDELCARYAALRGGVLSQAHVLELVEGFIGGIPEASYDLDLNLYTGRPMTDKDMKTQITDYVSRRFGILDSILEGNAK